MMSGLERDALVLELIDQLREHGSWAGETHVQKATYFLQELTGVPLGFDFIMYKYGPYSFDLHDELTAMQANQLLVLKPQLPYGPALLPGEMSPVLKKKFSKTIDHYGREIRFIAEKLGQKRVAELERLSTALYVASEFAPNKESREDYLVSFKPHVTKSQAALAFCELDQIEDEAKVLGRQMFRP